MTYLQEVDMDVATFENPIVVPTLHNKKDYIVGRTLFSHAYVRMVSSIEGKVYPPVQVDELGFRFSNSRFATPLKRRENSF